MEGKEKYPPVPAGKKLIFRWSITLSDGTVIRPKNGRPFPILVDE